MLGPADQEACPEGTVVSTAGEGQIVGGRQSAPPVPVECCLSLKGRFRFGDHWSGLINVEPGIREPEDTRFLSLRDRNRGKAIRVPTACCAKCQDSDDSKR